MTRNDTVTINGQQYDSLTGLPVHGDQPASEHKADVAERRNHTPATHLHSTTQRSVTLHRKSLQKPTHKIVGHPNRGRTISDFHGSIRKFAPHPVDAIRPRTPAAPAAAPVVRTHPAVARAHERSAAKAQTLSAHIPSASERKTEAVAHAIANTHKQAPLRTRMQPRQRVVAIFSAVFAFVLLGGYFTYLNMPALSVRVAAAQAGIDANYPNYRPDGYSLAGPVMYSDSRVSMNFQSNGGTQKFTVNQSKSSWNNEAVLDNFVTPRTGSNYIPYTERGLTIYTFDDNAAWVNGGILYTIEGDAPLSSEQIRRIATSLL